MTNGMGGFMIGVGHNNNDSKWMLFSYLDATYCAYICVRMCTFTYVLIDCSSIAYYYLPPLTLQGALAEHRGQQLPISLLEDALAIDCFEVQLETHAL